MTRDDIRLLFAYGRWANHRIVRAAFGLMPEQFTRDLGGSFRSVRDTPVHIIGGSGGGSRRMRFPVPPPTDFHVFQIEAAADREGQSHEIPV